MFESQGGRICRLPIRPLLLGSGPRIGVQPAEEYLFLILVTPVGPYFEQGQLTGIQFGEVPDKYGWTREVEV
jgi:branched-subunit amino acid aminotransferase/4-amino-4-deoxychorismate lyase